MNRRPYHFRLIFLILCLLTGVQSQLTAAVGDVSSRFTHGPGNSCVEVSVYQYDEAAVHVASTIDPDLIFSCLGGNQPQLSPSPSGFCLVESLARLYDHTYDGEPFSVSSHSTLAPGNGANSAQYQKLKGQLLGEEIAQGHGFEKHVLKQGEFKGLDIRTRNQYAAHAENVYANPSDIRYYQNGRTVYLQESTNTVLVKNPINGESTMFQPTDWSKYLSELPTRTTPY